MPHRADERRVSLHNTDVLRLQARGKSPELFFHTSPKGQKIDLIKKNNIAGFEIDHLTDVVKDENDCGVTAVYECVTGTGSIEIVNGIEKLTVISKYDEEKTEHKFSEQA